MKKIDFKMDGARVAIDDDDGHVSIDTADGEYIISIHGNSSQTSGSDPALASLRTLGVVNMQQEYDLLAEMVRIADVYSYVSFMVGGRRYKEAKAILAAVQPEPTPDDTAKRLERAELRLADMERVAGRLLRASSPIADITEWFAAQKDMQAILGEGGDA